VKAPPAKLYATAAAVLALAGATAGSPAAASASPSVAAANAAPQMFGVGKWTGSGYYSHSESSPMTATFTSAMRFTIVVAQDGSVRGGYREAVTGSGHRGRFRARLKGSAAAQVGGGAAAPVVVGDLTLVGKFTLGKLSMTKRFVRDFQKVLRIREAGCNRVSGPNWHATRVGTPPQPRSASWFEDEEASLISNMDVALGMTHASLAASQLRSILPKLQTFNAALNQARLCGRAPASYGRGLAGRREVVERLAALIKRITTEMSRIDSATYTASDVVDLVNLAVDAGLIGPGAANADAGVRSGLEGFLNDALSTVLGRVGQEGVVQEIRAAAQRAGMSSVVSRIK
jgi:hypothetical protein